MTKRNQTLDLFRILMMFAIVFHHFSYYAIGDVLFDTVNLQSMIVYLGHHIATPANIFFAILFGYFTSNYIKWNKVKDTLCLVYGYHIFFSLVGIALNGSHTINWFSILLPFDVYWFAEFYLFLLIVGPFMKRTLEKLSKKQCILVMTIVYAMIEFVPLILTFTPSSGATAILEVLTHNRIMYFPFFVFGLYLKKYPIRFNYIAFVLSLVPTILGLMDFLRGKTVSFWEISESYLKIGSFIFVALLISRILQSEKSFSSKSNKAIELIVPNVFAIYLIHEHPLIRTLLWETVFASANITPFLNNEIVFIFFAITVTILVFSGCFLIDFSRQKIIAKIKLQIC